MAVSFQLIILLLIAITFSHEYIIPKEDRNKTNEATKPSYQEFIDANNYYVEKMLENYPKKDNISGKFPPPKNADVKIERQNDYSYVMVTPVDVWVRVMKLVDMDSQAQTARLIVRHTYSWTDDNLAINKQLGLEEDEELVSVQLHVPSDRIWIPPIIPVNTISSVVISDPEIVNALTDGYLIYKIDMMHTIPCKVNIESFPFDVHNCSLELSQQPSLIYKMKFISSVKEHHKSDVNNFWNESRHESVEWDVISWDHFVRIFPIDDGSSIDPYQIDSLFVKVVFKRNSVFYAFVFIVPIIFLNNLSLVIFKLPVNSKDKDDFAKSLILTYFVLLTSIVDKSPTTGDSIPVLGIYIIVSILVLALSLAMCLLIVDVQNHYMMKHKNMNRFLVHIVESKWCMKTFGSHYRSYLKKADKDHQLQHTGETDNDGKKETLIAASPPVIPTKTRTTLRWKTLNKMLKLFFFWTIVACHVLVGIFTLAYATTHNH